MLLLRLAPVAAALALSGCGGSTDAQRTDRGEPQETPSVTQTTPPEQPELANTCENAELRLSVRYPAGWWTNPGTVAPRCRFFHPEPPELEPGTEPPPTAVSLQEVRRGLDRLVADVESSTRVRSRREARVAGGRALVLETESTGSGLRPSGTRTYAYYVEHGARTLVASTSDAGGLDYAANRETLDAMMATLDLGPRSRVEPPPITTDST
jgi:hypothetical protein